MKENKRIFANIDRDTLCFLATVALLCGVAGLVQVSANRDVKEARKNENVMNVVEAQRDTISAQQAKVMDLVSTKQK